MSMMKRALEDQIMELAEENGYDFDGLSNQNLKGDFSR